MDKQNIENFNRYKEEIFDFDRFNSLAKEGYVDRVGKPDELSAAIGIITIAFNSLEETIAKGIWTLLNVDEKTGAIVTSELSYRMKVNLFSSLVHSQMDTHHFNRLKGVGFQDGYLKELTKALTRCEELRNRVIHSVYLTTFGDDPKTVRQKTSAKAKHGLVKTTENVDIVYFLNIYEYTASMEMEIDDFFMGFRRNVMLE